MSSTLDALLDSIDPARTLDAVAARADDALNTFSVEAGRIAGWEAFRACLVGFLRHLESDGIESAGVACFPDHHHYTRNDCVDLERRCRRSDGDWLLTTHKDAIKIDPSWMSDTPVYMLRLTLELTAGDDLAAAVTAGVAGP